MASIQFEFAFSGIEIANHTFLPNPTFQDVHTYISNHPKIQHDHLVQVQLFDNHDLKKPLSLCSKMPTTISVLRITNPRAPELRAQLQKEPTLLLKHTKDVDTTKLLLQLNADPNTKGKYGSTPLHWASCYEYVETARLLLQSNADPNSKDKDGYTPLHEASINGHVDMARLLLQFKADPNTKDKNGITPLGRAFNPEIKQLLESIMQVE